ncbi:MAG TPA: recombinase family protein [Methylomirabilota bacterium]|nr:recombinase family protein [Methylomirabilota bacterium]
MMKANREGLALPKEVGIWIRVSTDEQAKGDSPQHHEERARELAKARGWIVKEIYHLEGVSGKAVLQHREAQRMIADIRRGHITGLVFSKLARLARNRRELDEIAEIFQEHHADLVSISDNIDTSTALGRMFYGLTAVFAQWEREEIAERVQASVLIRAKLGKPLTGRAPYGYHWRDKKLQPHPDEGPVRKLMYELFAQHGRKKTVARILNERGYRTRDGSNFSDTTVGRLIQDTTAKGIHRANYTKRVAGDRPWALKPEHEWVLNPCEPLISEELWQQCNDLLESRRVTGQRPAKRVAHLFAGVVHCACGQKMYVPTNSRKYTCMKCRNKIPIVDLDNVFRDQLLRFMVSPEHVCEYLRTASDTLSSKEELVESLKREFERVNRDCDVAFELYKTGGLTVTQFKEKYQPLDKRKQEIAAELPRLQGELDALRLNTLSEEYLTKEVHGLHARWPNMEQEDRRQVIEQIVTEMIVGSGQISIKFCHLPAFEQMTIGQRTV